MLRRRSRKIKKKDDKNRKLTLQEVKNRKKRRGKREQEKKRIRMQITTLQNAISTQK
jgi:hypothetical protein